jgi:hypothetical protein
MWQPHRHPEPCANWIACFFFGLPKNFHEMLEPLPHSQRRNAMKKKQMRLVAGLAITLALVAAGAFAMEIDKGFTDIAWGTYIDQLEQMRLLGSSDEVSYYVIPGRAYTIFETEIDQVIYGFYRERLFAVYVDLKSIDAYTKLKSEISRKYGYPKVSMETRLNQTHYIWSHGDVKIKLKHEETSGKMKLAFYYTPLSSRVNLERQEAYEPPGRKLFPLTDRQKTEAIRTYEVFDSYSP